MTHAETHHRFSLFGLVEKRLSNVEYQGKEHITFLRPEKQDEKKILYVSDHVPGEWPTLYTAGLLLFHPNRTNTGILVKEELVSGIRGGIIKQLFSHYKMRPFPVQTTKYHKDEHSRNLTNASYERQIIKFCNEEKWELLTFASGTRTENMQEAEGGLKLLAKKSDLIVPLTTVLKKDESPRIIVHEPIPGMVGIQWCVKNFGAEFGKQAFSDLVMTIIATGQPDEDKRGFYREFSKVLITFQNTSIFPQFTDFRLRRMLQTYIAWKEHFPVETPQ